MHPGTSSVYSKSRLCRSAKLKRNRYIRKSVKIKCKYQCIGGLCADMNYKLIHDKIIQYIRDTEPKTRIRKRNSKDYRLQNEVLYVEIHHIIPRSLGGLDISNNLVEVLPEEHIFLHMLRYKIYKKREDALAVRFMLNGFSNKKHLSNIKLILNKKIRSGYSWIRTHAQGVREADGWHTERGIQNISKARKGTMPAKDIDTGEMIGAVSVNHPNVLSGKWVHHTKGRKMPENEKAVHSKLNKGQNNPNASGLSEDYLIKKGVEISKQYGQIVSWNAMVKLSSKLGFPWIKSNKSRFNGTGSQGYYQAIEKETGLKRDAWTRLKII